MALSPYHVPNIRFSHLFPRQIKIIAMPLLASFALDFAFMDLRPAYAAPRDEVRVYTDSIEEKGEWGLELHFNSVPRPRISTVEPGQPRAMSGMILTPELSYGLSNTVELEFGFLLPKVRLDDGNGLQVVPHLRAKWIPKQAKPEAQAGDWFYGGIIEWSPSPYRRGATLEDASSYISLRPILGYRTAHWLFAGNLILEWPLNLRNASANDVARPEFAPALKVLRSFSDRFATGLEYHGEWGSARKFSASGEQAHTLYWIIERKKPFWMSLGFGYGLNRTSGGFSIKGSLEIPLD
jgi:hypothetical protein